MNAPLEFDVTAELGVGADLPPYSGWARLTAPSAHLVSEFTEVSYLDPATGQRKATMEAADEDLVIIHTEDQQLAFGMVTKPRPPTSSGAPGVHYQYNDFSKISDFDDYLRSTLFRNSLSLHR